MRNVNIGGSWMDEFYKIAQEKGWSIQKEAISHKEVEKIWGSLPVGTKNKLIPEWDGLSFSDLMNKIELKWSPIMMEYQKLQEPKGDVSFDPSQIKVEPEKVEKPVKTKSSLSPTLISKIQALLFKATGMNVSDPKSEYLGGPDGSWGPMSATAWNQYVERYTTPGGPLVVDPVDESGKELPNIEDIRYVLSDPKLNKADDVSEANDPYQDWASKMPELSYKDIDIKVPTSQDILKRMHGKSPGQQPGDVSVSPTDWRSRYRGMRGIPEDVSEAEHLGVMRLLRQQGTVGPIKDKNQYLQALKQVREQRSAKPQAFVPKTPEWASADDVTASVINELTSLANDLDSFGEENAAMLVDHQIRSYAAVARKFYNVTKETGDQLIGQAHPGGGPVLVPAEDEGGKVETIVEEHKKMVERSTKQPTGKYAEVMTKLIATANKLEDEGEFEAAKIVDKTIEELRKSNPFVGRGTAFEAAGSKDINASVKKAQDFSQTVKLRTILARLEKILNQLEGEVENQGPRVVGKNLNIDIMDAATDKDKYEQVITEYSIPGVQGPASYKYDDIITKMRKEVQSWRQQVSGWPKDKNHAQWMLSNINGWKPALNVIKKYYESFTSDEVSGNWDQSFDLNLSSIIEEMQELSNTYDKTKGTNLQREVPKVVPGKGTTTSPATEKSPSTTREKYEALQKKEIGDRINQYVKILDNFGNFVAQNAKVLKAKLGEPAFEKLLDWPDKQKYNILQSKKSKYPVTLTDKSIQNLTNYLSKLQSAVKSASIRTADDVPNIQVPDKNAPVVKKFPTVKKPGVKRVSKIDPDVKKLQQALMAAGITLEFKDDGKWGTETMAGWEELRHMVPRANLSSAAEKNLDALKPEFQRAIRFAIALSNTKKQEEIKFKVDGKEFTSGDFADLSSALTALDRSYGLNREEMHDDKYVRSIWSALVNIYKKLGGEEGNFISNYNGPQVLNALKGAVYSLLKQIYDRGLPAKNQEEGVPGIPGLQEKPGSPQQGQGGVGYQKRTDWAPGSKDVGIKGLNYPQQLNTLDDIKLSIAYLPSNIVLGTRENFMTYSYSVFRRKGSTKLPKTYKEAAKLYFGMLRNRVAEILAAIGEKSGEIRATQPGLLRDMEEDIMSFNRALLAIGQQLGFVE